MVIKEDRTASHFASEGKKAGQGIRFYTCRSLFDNNVVNEDLKFDSENPEDEHTPHFVYLPIIKQWRWMYDYRHTTYPFPASEKDLSMAHLHFEETEASNGGHYFIVFFQPKKAVEEIQGVHGRNDLVDRLGGVEVWGPLFLVRCVFGPPLDGEYPNFIFLDMPERQEDCPERVQAFLNGTAGTINIPDVM